MADNQPCNPYLIPHERLEDRAGYPFKRRVTITTMTVVDIPTPQGCVKLGWLFDGAHATQKLTQR